MVLVSVRRTHPTYLSLGPKRRCRDCQLKTLAARFSPLHDFVAGTSQQRDRRAVQPSLYATFCLHRPWGGETYISSTRLTFVPYLLPSSRQASRSKTHTHILTLTGSQIMVEHFSAFNRTETHVFSLVFQMARSMPNKKRYTHRHTSSRQG